MDDTKNQKNSVLRSTYLEEIMISFKQKECRGLENWAFFSLGVFFQGLNQMNNLGNNFLLRLKDFRKTL